MARRLEKRIRQIRTALGLSVIPANAGIHVNQPLKWIPAFARMTFPEYICVSLGRASPSTAQVHRILLEHPIATSALLAEKTKLAPATVNKCLSYLEELGIVRELTQQKRNRLYSYARYVEIMNQGTELPPR